MSRIQKALEAQRHGNDDGSETRSHERSHAMERRQRVRREMREPREPRKQVTSDAQDGSGLEWTEEVVPGSSIEIDRADLVRLGLLPGQNHVDRISDQFRRVKRPIVQSAFEVDLPVGENANVIMVASALPGAGKSFCSFNLAQSIATERDVDSILVDADVLKPTISRALGLQDHNGLIDYLTDSSIELEDILVATNLQGTYVIPAGHKNPDATELLASRRMQRLISQLSKRFGDRAVIFDTPPLLITSEAQVLAERMGQIVLVIEARVSSQESVMRALSLLDRDKPINAILNKSRSATQSGYLSDDYGYYPYTNRNDNDAGQQ